MKQVITSSLSVLVIFSVFGSGSTATACPFEPLIGSVCVMVSNYCPGGYLVADGRSVKVTDYTALFSLTGKSYGPYVSSPDGKEDTFTLPDLRGRVVVGASIGVSETQPTGSGNANTLTPVEFAQQVGQESVQLSPLQVPLASHTHMVDLGAARAKGDIALPVTGSAAEMKVTGTIEPKALSAKTGGGGNLPSTTNPTVGRTSGTSTTFYSPGVGDVAVPTSFDLKAAGGTVNGTASGPVILNLDGPVTTSPAAQPAGMPVPTQPPSLGLTVCIAAYGIYPTRP